MYILSFYLSILLSSDLYFSFFLLIFHKREERGRGRREGGRGKERERKSERSSEIKRDQEIKRSRERERLRAFVCAGVHACFEGERDGSGAGEGPGLAGLVAGGDEDEEDGQHAVGIPGLG